MLESNVEGRGILCEEGVDGRDIMSMVILCLWLTIYDSLLYKVI